MGRALRWSRADASRALVLMGLSGGVFLGGAGFLVAGLAELAGLRYAWNRAWSLVGGITSSAVGALLVADWILRRLR